MPKHSRPGIPVGIIGATGTVGRQFIQLLEHHPWFTLRCVAASSRSAGQCLGDLLSSRHNMTVQQPEVARLRLYDAEKDIDKMANEACLVFSAVNLEKKATRRLEEHYAAAGVAVVSNNSAHRWTEDVPMVIPEINPDHLMLIHRQRNQRKWDRGLIAVKSNCSIQSYMPVLDAWRQFAPEKVIVSTYQAVSGAGKTVAQWPEMQDNVIPFIGGEEEKSEREPLKIWAQLDGDGLILPNRPVISATCVRVPVSDGHLAVAHVAFAQKPPRQALIEAIHSYPNPIANLNLPSAPSPYLQYCDEEDRPQTAVDRLAGRGMAVSVGRIREDSVLDYKFVALSHNTLRGAAGGAMLLAELLCAKGYVNDKPGTAQSCTAFFD